MQQERFNQFTSAPSIGPVIQQQQSPDKAQKAVFDDRPILAGGGGGLFYFWQLGRSL